MANNPAKWAVWFALAVGAVGGFIVATWVWLPRFGIGEEYREGFWEGVGFGVGLVLIFWLISTLATWADRVRNRLM